MASDSDNLDSKSAPKVTAIPVVILGTMTHDPHSLQLANFLNQMSASGQIEVYYFPQSDLSAPLNIPLTDSQVRVQHPLRVPEDISTVDIGQHSTQKQYYEKVAEILKGQGKEAYTIMYPQLERYVPAVTRHIRGNYDDYGYEQEPNSSVTTTAHPDYGMQSFLNYESFLEMFGAANMSTIVALQPAAISAESCDRVKLRAELFKNIRVSGTNAAFGDQYYDGMVDFISKRGVKASQVKKDTIVKATGVPFDLQTSTDRLRAVVEKTLTRLVNAPSLVEDARVVAQKIIDDANKLAKEELDKSRDLVKSEKAKFEAKIAGDLEQAAEKAKEIIEVALAQSEDITAAALELANMSGEFHEILAPIVASSLAHQRSIEADEINRRLDGKKQQRSEVKNLCDIFSKHIDDVGEYELSGWGKFCNSVSHREKLISWNLSIDALNFRNDLLSDIDELRRKLNDTLLENEIMTLEEAVTVAAVDFYIRKLTDSKAGKSVFEYEDYEVREAFEWHFDQEEIQNAMLVAFTAHAEKFGLTSDLPFLTACNLKLDGDIAEQLTQALQVSPMQQAKEELEGMSGFGVISSDLDELVSEIEVRVSKRSRSYNTDISKSAELNGGALADTLREVEMAAANVNRSTVVTQQTANVTQSAGFGQLAQR